MTHYKPSWKDGTETRQEEALWPYVVCTIASRQIVTQNIGIVKAMAKDKAITGKKMCRLSCTCRTGKTVL